LRHLLAISMQLPSPSRNSATWRHDGFRNPMPSGLSSADVFTKKVLDGKVVEGSYKSAAPGNFRQHVWL